MGFFNWDTTLDVGVDAMNDQHQLLIGLMNRLHDRHTAGADHEELAKIFQDLAEYTVHHFAREEAYMESVAFPGRESHHRIHADLLGKLATHHDAFKQGEPLGEQLFRFLAFWLAAHIRGVDTKYGQHAKKHAA
jgi:hemerythrin-like metal-binding protein